MGNLNSVSKFRKGIAASGLYDFYRRIFLPDLLSQKLGNLKNYMLFTVPAVRSRCTGILASMTWIDHNSPEAYVTVGILPGHMK